MGKKFIGAGWRTDRAAALVEHAWEAGAAAVFFAGGWLTMRWMDTNYGVLNYRVITSLEGEEWNGRTSFGGEVWRGWES